MIFLSVGTQLGFDRLVRAVDEWRVGVNDVGVVAQIGPGDYVPEHMWSTSTLDPGRYEMLVQAASVLVTHAGIGSLLTACRAQKPIVMLPRRFDLGEHRNNHQVEGASRIFAARGAHIARSVSELKGLLDNWRELTPPDNSQELGHGLLHRLSSFLGSPSPLPRRTIR